MPEDRFGDLGGTRAGDKLADLDRTEPEDAPRRPRRQEPGRSYMWVVGVAGVIVIAIVAINSLPNAGRGSSGLPAGEHIPKFAAPQALGPAPNDADANIKQSKDDDSTGNNTPACEVTTPGALKICDYTSKPLVITFIVPGAKDCESFMDRIQRVRTKFPGVNFVGVVSGADKNRVDELVRDHRWTFPVAVDHNLALFNTYRVALCATSIFVYRGGVVRTSKVEAQKFTPAQLNAAIKSIE